MDKTTSKFWENDNITDLTEAKAALNLQRAVLRTVSELVEFWDDDTGGHIERTRGYLGILVGALIKNDIYSQEVDTWDIWLVLNSAQLHDVGKIAISDSILKKPDKLTDEEFEQIKEHTVFGEKVIDKISGYTTEQSFLKYAKVFVSTHHEKWNGSGYPRGLSGENIPLLGRLMAIADVYDALVSDRPYKKAFTHMQAVEIITKSRETHFDPVLVDVFLDVADDFDKIAREYLNHP